MFSSVFYWLGELSAIFNKFKKKLLSANASSLEEPKSCHLGKGLEFDPSPLKPQMPDADAAPVHRSVTPINFGLKWK